MAVGLDARGGSLHRLKFLLASSLKRNSVFEISRWSSLVGSLNREVLIFSIDGDRTLATTGTWRTSIDTKMEALALEEQARKPYITARPRRAKLVQLPGETRAVPELDIAQLPGMKKAELRLESTTLSFQPRL